MAFVYPTDQFNLWEILGLKDTEELLQNGQLFRLMKYLDAFDAKNNTALTELVQCEIEKYQEIDCKFAEYIAMGDTREIIKEATFQETEITYQGRGAMLQYKRQLSQIRQKISDLLDPCGCLVGRYGHASVIAT